MTVMTAGISRHHHAQARREVTIWDLVVWAFKAECAQLDPPRSPGGFGPSMVSSSYLICQHEMLGCRIDGGGRSDPHPDADLVAAAVASLPEGCGGWSMALTIAELARAEMVPHWDVRCSVVPVAWHQNRHGRRAATADAREYGELAFHPTPRRNAKGVIVYDPIRCCPVVIRGGPAEQAAARRNYLQWWSALLELRNTFKMRDDLSAHLVLDHMPERAPWKKALDGF